MVTLIEPENRCPYIRRVGVGEYSRDYCELTEKPSGRIHPCILVSSETCEIWEEIKREWAEEK